MSAKEYDIVRHFHRFTMNRVVKLPYMVIFDKVVVVKYIILGQTFAECSTTFQRLSNL